MTQQDRADRVAIVTGASGAIGAAVAERLRENGDHVVGLDARPGEGVLCCDVTREDEVDTAFRQVATEAGPVRVLVHAAGVTGSGSVEEEPPDEWRRILEVNLTSAYLVTRAAIPQMRAAGGGAIVLVASVNARFGGSALSGPAYAASKGGLVTLARFLAREHAADGITVNAVAPGPHATPMWEALDAQRRERILAMIPGGRGPGDPRDLAATIVHLCAPESGYITGATIDVNGGQWMG
ncbi:MAG TPA: SDR family NAD(P)-dependent oxidoreductase [Acidimicrobiales bacterium]|jgi:NAD(P)-dependent dehydrogenase (short-subunit alcohol dehydrogenase family)|nr:SDR family NAD(P)-dependent oxidoreductase [Acidimicrobiales bacterium]